MRLSTLACGLAALLLSAPAAVAEDAPAPPPPPGPTIPVSVAKVLRRDVPVVIRGLGTVQAYYSVLLRTQVDGRLTQIPVTEGQTVKKGDLLAAIDTRPYQAALDAALAKKQQDEALLTSAQADMVRYAELARRDVASHQKVEATQALVGQLTAAIAGDTALIDTAKVNLGFCAILAPFDGRVGLRTVDPGTFVRAAEATPIMALAQLQPIAATFTVPQDNLPAILRAIGMGKPKVTAFGSDNATELDKGEVLTIDNAIDATTGTIKVKAVFPNADFRLWPGQFVNTRLLVGTMGSALTVPSSAVQHGQDRLFVYAVKDDQTVQARTVEVASDDGVIAVLSKGVEEGQTVVIDGHSRLRNGLKIAISGGPAKSGG
ncbi:MAG: efflux RND transporter periplasmic adaptor subunit [Rhodospirillales bacterium]